MEPVASCGRPWLYMYRHYQIRAKSQHLNPDLDPKTAPEVVPDRQQQEPK